MARDDEELSCSAKWAIYLTGGVMAIASIMLIVVVIYGAVWTLTRPADTTYTVTINSVDDLDPAMDLHSEWQTLSPVFGITVRIENTHNKLMEECIGSVDSSAVVSYGGALLGKGAVPGFCVRTSEVGEAATKAWGTNVEVPPFLRHQLAGELEKGQAVVDVVVRTPGGEGCYMNRCVDKVLVCKAKIGEGSSECYLAY